MFADDVGLLPQHMYTRILQHARPAPERFTDGHWRSCGIDMVSWFDGGLFDDRSALLLEKSDIEMVPAAAADLDWSELDPRPRDAVQAPSAARVNLALGGLRVPDVRLPNAPGFLLWDSQLPASSGHNDEDNCRSARTRMTPSARTTGDPLVLAHRVMRPWLLVGLPNSIGSPPGPMRGSLSGRRPS